jgi:Domain of unknown function (DUF4251)
MLLNKFHRLLLPFLILLSIESVAQNGTDQKKLDKQVQLKSMIDSKHFQFHALSATSMKGKTVQLTSEYSLKLNKDSLNVDLPYYGRSYTADYPGTDVSVRFKSNQFTYSSDSTKKGGWEITIIPKNESKANKIYMAVTSSGYCTVNINSNTRQSISYYGYIKDYDAR